ncbi:MAG: TetR family transcriptional regulator [Chloroflexi bacterium]|nr:MAG: TetR family transcriptional regulator [Chloroflexota bacterium]
MSAGTPAPVGLRERKKLATREALAQAALRLALERGLEHVRVEDVAAEAGVSARTFNNYFASKEEAIVSIGVDRAAATAEALLRRPADEPLVESLCHAVAGQHLAADRVDRDHVERIRLVISSPALRGEYLKAIVASERPLARAIAERTEADAAGLHPRVVAAAVTSATRVATAHWVQSGGTGSLADVIREAIRQVVGDAGADR